jgi:formate hydrogenlyase transcriptional activator
MNDSLEARLQATLNVIPANTWYAAPNGALIFVNVRAADFMGLPVDHPLRFGINIGAAWDSHFSLLHPDDRDEARRAWADCLKSGSESESTFRVRNAQGGYRWRISRAEPLRANDGTLLYWVGINLDIEELKRAEHELRDIVDTIPAILWVALPDGSNTYANSRFVEYSGISAAQTAGSGWQATIHPDDLARHYGKWRASAASGEPHESEVRFRRADGQYRWHLDRGLPLRDETGNIVKWYGVVADIEDRKRAEEALRRNERFLAEAQRLSHTGCFAWNVSTDEHFWSDETFRIFEFDRSSKVSLPRILERVHPQDWPSVKMALAAVNEAEAIDVETRLLMPSGKTKYLHVVGKAARDGIGSIDVIGAVMDVTARKMIEVELQRSKAHLTDAQRLSRTGSVGMKVSTKQLFWSEEAARIYGYTPGTEPTVDLVLQRVHPDDVALLKSVLDRAAQGGSSFDFEHRLLMPDGSIKHLRSLSHSLTDEAGNEEAVGAIMDITEHKVAEETIRRSEAYQAEAQRLSHTGTWAVKNLNGELTVVYWSEESYRIYGLDPRQALPTRVWVWQQAHPDDRYSLFKETYEARRQKKDFQVEFRILLSDGTVKYLEAIGHHVFSADGELLEILGTHIDVTERKHVEEALRRNEHFLAEAQRLSHTGSFGWRPDDGEIVWSDETYRIFEYDSTLRPTIDAVVQRIHPDDRALAQQVINRVSQTGTDFEHEYRLLLADGRVKHVHAIVHAVQNARGDREFIGAVTDITERKSAEDKVRKQEAEFRQVLDLAPQLVAVFGPNRERWYANSGTLAYLGTTLDEWRRHSAGSSLHPDDVERDRAAAERATSTRSPYELEIRLRGGDGFYRWFLARYNPLCDEQGQATRWYVACADIEDRKRTEQRLQEENVALREEIDKTSMFEEIVGTSPALTAVLARVSKVAGSDSTVLISGETGTGKELVARAIHRRSGRSSKAFVAVNCAAIPRDLIASELFGHEKGAFTGALQRRLGRFELANGGTIFFDEVGELSPDIQIALLRVLQEREIERVGGRESIHVDVRVIAATNRDLMDAVANGTFRQDFFYRLNVFPLEIPPLRERKQDIPVLVEYFIHRYARKAGKTFRHVNKRTLGRLQHYPWPGNVRELQNVIERSVIVSDTDDFIVDESWLSARVAAKGSRAMPSTLAAHEKVLIEEALRASGGRVYGPSGAAVRLGIPRTTLDSRILALKINKKHFQPRTAKIKR